MTFTFKTLRFLFCGFCFTGVLMGCTAFPKTTPTPTSYSLSQPTLNSKIRNQRIAKLKNFDAYGKLGFSDGHSGGNASLYWEQRAEQYTIRLSGPLGSGSVKIQGEPGHVYLVQSNGKAAAAKSPEGLVKAELGWKIPVSSLRYWLLGIPDPGKPTEHLLVENEKIKELGQQGWTIFYQTYQQVKGLDLPHKIVLQNGPIRLKFIFRHWDFS